jgi:hypothetical protein
VLEKRRFVAFFANVSLVLQYADAVGSFTFLEAFAFKTSYKQFPL